MGINLTSTSIPYDMTNLLSIMIKKMTKNLAKITNTSLTNTISISESRRWFEHDSISKEWKKKAVYQRIGKSLETFRPFRIIESETLENKYHCNSSDFFPFHPPLYFPFHGSYDTRYATDNASTSFRWKANPFSAKLHTPLVYVVFCDNTREYHFSSLLRSTHIPSPLSLFCIFFHFIIHSFIYFAICLFWDFMTKSSCKFIEGVEMI